MNAQNFDHARRHAHAPNARNREGSGLTPSVASDQARACVLTRIARLGRGALRSAALPVALSAVMLASTALISTGSFAGPFDSAAAAAVVSFSGTASTERWNERLEALDPMRPYDYLALAEEVADAASSERERQLARELFGLAGALDTERLGRSALLALAQFATDRRERERALAAAEIVGGRGGSLRTFRIEPEQLEALSRAFSFYRRGEGRKALNVLRQADADAVLDEIGVAIPGGADGFRAELEAMRGGGAARPDPQSVRRLLLLELALRQGDARAVSLDILLRGDEPLIEIDPSDPAALWQVDPTKPWWRNGKWSGGT